jgi:hypothetical protein
MMKKKDFYSDIKHLHKVIVAEIVALMVEHDVTEVDLAGSSADHAYVIGVPDFDWDIDYIEAEVLKVYYEDGQLVLDVCWDVDTDELAAQNENGDIGDAYTDIKANDFMRIKPCAGIETVYDSVWQVLEQGK